MKSQAHADFRDVPGDSLDFLHTEAVRQLEELSKAKESIDSRAALVIGIPGVMLSVFVSIFVSFWTSPQVPGLVETDRFLVSLALLLTIGVVFTLLGAVGLGLSTLSPKSFDLGTELVDTYKKAHDPTVEHLGLKEGSLRVLIRSFINNLPTYYLNVFRYNLASLLVVVSLAYAAEFVGIVISAAGWIDSRVQIAVDWILLSAWVGTSLVAFHIGWRNWKSTKGLISIERRRLTRLEEYVHEADNRNEAAD